MSRCVFCRIADGDLPSRTVYEDEAVLAFLDANPLARGHTLVVPKAHHERIEDMDAETADAVFDALYRLVPRVQDAVDADGSNVGFNNGTASGQEVPHVHGHVVPRFAGDGGGPIHRVAGERPHLSEAELDDVAEAIRTEVE